MVAQDQAISAYYIKRILKQEFESKCWLRKECEQTIDHPLSIKIELKQKKAGIPIYLSR
jgi:hypothetical protein